MNGLELSRGYFEEYGLPMLQKDFPDILKYLACGFVGRGSEHFGFDDESSTDHDFGPGFCIFLPGEDIVDRRTEFLLERAYAKLPKEYNGIKRQNISPVGGNRDGVIRTADFYLSAVGASDGILSDEAFLKIPDYALAEAVNGEIFFDEYGEFTAIREYLSFMPKDVKLKRIAGNLLIMAQSGQYNFMRCLGHGEAEAAQLALFEFINAAIKVKFLLCGKYAPYYKWSFRALRELDGGSFLSEKFSFLLFGNSKDSATAQEKMFTVEEVASYFINELQEKNMTNAICGDLEKHAYSVNDGIGDSKIRNMHILAAI